MKQLSVYLTFGGNCEEALNFYKECLNGEIISIQKFKDGPIDVKESEKNKVLHAQFKADDVFFMASDGMEDYIPDGGSMVSLSLNVPDKKEQETIFNKLSKGGKVTMPLQKQFWGATFGMLTDKYGIQWMLNSENE